LPSRIAKVIYREINNLDVLHSQWTYENAVATLSFAKKTPLLCSVRDWYPILSKFLSNSNFRNFILWNFSNKILFNHTISEKSITFVANSEYTRQCIRSIRPNYNVPIIENPINSKYLIENRDFVFNNVFISIAISLLDTRKNIVTLLKAFRQYRESTPCAKLILVGHISKEDERYDQLNKQNLLQNVQICGSLSHENVIEEIDSASVLIHPSLEETYGNILLEAMARRVLVVGGINSGAVPQVLGNGEYGVLCDVSNHENILKVMLDIKNNSLEYSKMVDKASYHLKKELTDEAVAEKLVALYRERVVANQTTI
jgi:glycosyltransferase involved in cell wall biosynthesis